MNKLPADFRVFPKPGVMVGGKFYPLFRGAARLLELALSNVGNFVSPEKMARYAQIRETSVHNYVGKIRPILLDLGFSIHHAIGLGWIVKKRPKR